MIQPRLHHSLPVEAQQLISRTLHFRFNCIRRERHDLGSGLSVPADEERVADTARSARLRYQRLSQCAGFQISGTDVALLQDLRRMTTT